jgi:hypothetical protein
MSACCRCCPEPLIPSSYVKLSGPDAQPPGLYMFPSLKGTELICAVRRLYFEKNKGKKPDPSPKVTLNDDKCSYTWVCPCGSRSFPVLDMSYIMCGTKGVTKAAQGRDALDLSLDSVRILLKELPKMLPILALGSGEGPPSYPPPPPAGQQQQLRQTVPRSFYTERPPEGMMMSNSDDEELSSDEDTPCKYPPASPNLLRKHLKSVVPSGQPKPYENMSDGQEVPQTPGTAKRNEKDPNWKGPNWDLSP